MSEDAIELTVLGERLARVRRTCGENIDLPNFEPNLFAVLLGASVIACESCERGEKEPTVEFLVALRKKTGLVWTGSWTRIKRPLTERHSEDVWYQQMDSITDGR
jgi:hypothetical protein